MNVKTMAISTITVMVVLAMITTTAMACFESCGTKIEQCTDGTATEDAVYALVIPNVTPGVPGMQLAWHDADGDGRFEYGECAYIDTNAGVLPVVPPADQVQQGDIRLCGSCGEDPNTPLIACANEIGMQLTYPAQTVVGYVDINGNGYYDIDDPLYLDEIAVVPTGGIGFVSVGDIRLTGRTDGIMNFPAYSVVNMSDFDITSNPNALNDLTAPVPPAPAPLFTPMNNLLGFVDSDCDNAWDAEGRDKLYLQQMVLVPVPAVGVLDPFEDFVTIGDFRLYMPPDEPCWPDCGTKVEQCDPDAVYALLIPFVDVSLTGQPNPAMQLNWVDKNNNRRFGSGDNVYIDTNPGTGRVAAGDVRLTGCCGCPPNTVVGVCGWCDIGDVFSTGVNAPALLTDQQIVGFVDLNNNQRYDVGDPLYLDTSGLGARLTGVGVVSANDIRLTARNISGTIYAEYSIVQNGDWDTAIPPTQLLDTAIAGHAQLAPPLVGTPINNLLGFVDSNCDGQWATDGTDKLYLQQIVIALPIPLVYNQFDNFPTIGDFRLYMPTDEPCWPDCGTKVVPCDEDAVYGLMTPLTATLDVIVPAMQFAFNDVDGNAWFDIGECAYIDTNAGGPLRVDVGDVRLCGCCGMEPNTVVKGCDCDYDTPLTVPAQTIVGYVDINSDGIYDVGDPLYLDTGQVGPNSAGFVSSADIRLTGRGVYKPYSVVQVGDADVGPDNPLSDPGSNVQLPLPGTNIISFYLGFIDSDCNSVWDSNGNGELYLQQMVAAPAPAEPQFNMFSTIGDFRLYIPPGSVGTTYNPYDTNQNCKIEMGELAIAIGDWKAGTLPMGDLATLIGYWKAGSYC